MPMDTVAGHALALMPREKLMCLGKAHVFGKPAKLSWDVVPSLFKTAAFGGLL